MKLARLALLTALFSASGNLLAEDVDLGWLAGHWTYDLNGLQMQEIWMQPGADQMLGMGRTLDNGKLLTWEFLRIEIGDVQSYFASPNGREPVEFKLVASEPGKVVFENPEHGFPQRIEYQRDDDRLFIRISTIDLSQVSEWFMQLND